MNQVEPEPHLVCGHLASATTGPVWEWVRKNVVIVFTERTNPFYFPFQTGGGTKVCSEKLHQEAHGRAQRPDHSQEDDSQGNIGLSVASFKSLSRWRGRGERHQIQLDDVLCPPLARGLCRCFTNRRRHPSVHQSPSLEAPLMPARMVRARICG